MSRPIALTRINRVVVGVALVLGLTSGFGCKNGSTGSSPSGSSIGPAVTSAQFVDLDSNGVDEGDLLVLTFEDGVFITSATINAVDLLTTGDSLGSGATQAQSVSGSDRVEITLGTSPTLVPGTSLLNIRSLGTFNIKDENENRVKAGPANLVVASSSASAPTLMSSSYNDVDMDGTINGGDTILCVFDLPITIPIGQTVAGNFVLPVGTGGSPDSFGAGATLTAFSPNAENRGALITLGTAPQLTTSGVFDAAILTDGSPSGVQASTPGIMNATSTAAATDGTTVDLVVADSMRIMTMKPGSLFAGNTDAFSADVSPSGQFAPLGACHFEDAINFSGTDVDFDVLFVADTSNNRVLIYDPRPTGNNAQATVVLGQATFYENFANRSEVASTTPTASTLSAPGDVHFDPDNNQLWVSDTGNNRVLVWSDVFDASGLALSNGVAADLVLGQTTMIGRNANQGGAAPTSRTLSAPMGIHAEDGQVAVADSGNHRVLIWSSVPTSDNAAASTVLGQSNFISGLENRGGVAAADTCSSPSDVFLDTDFMLNASTGAVLIADTGNNRCLAFETSAPASGASADRVIGQTFGDFATVTAGTTATALSAPSGIYAVEDAATDKIYVADRDNHRVMVYVFDGTDATGLGVIGTATGAAIGQADDVTGTDNQGGTPGTNTMSFPERVTVTVTSDTMVAPQLFVADSENHRVLNFATLPTVNDTDADVLQGQPTDSSSFPNGHLMNRPAAMIIAGGRMIVADEGNNRVLIYNEVPSSGNPDPDVILGQATMFGTLANQGGSASAATMSGPQSVATDGTRLVVADTGNNRVLVFDDLSTVATGDAADRIVGQAGTTLTDANSGGVSAATLDSPCGVTIAGTRLLICDRDNHRVLWFDDITALLATGTSADMVLGQGDFVSNLENRGTSTSGTTMAAPRGIHVNGTKLFVADTDNNRVLAWTTFPTSNGQTANFAIGQNNLSSSTSTVGSAGMSAPRGVATDGERFVVADTGNNRVIVFDSIPITNDASADTVVGQGTFSASQPNNSLNEPGEQTLFGPYGVFYNGVDLWVVDQMNSRVVRFR
ncbi:MAG: NHL repeat-containing protein [Planctomycetota bacterium]